MKHENENATNLSDDELIKLCQQNKYEFFAVLYDRYKHSIINFAYRMLNDKSIAEDVLQETFLYVFKITPNYVSESKFKTLLFKVARNLSIDRLRKMKKVRFVQVDESMISVKEEAPEVKSHILNAIENLPIIYKEVLLLRLEKELSYEDISSITGLPIGTVKSRIHNALEILRKSIKLEQS